MGCFADNSEACELHSIGEFIDRSGKVGRVEVLRCKRCGHGVSMPPLPDVGFLYENRESQDYQPGSKGLSRKIKNIAFRPQAKKLLRQIGRPQARFLDFGCGSGQFTRVLGDVALGSEVIGADMHSAPPPELAGAKYLGPSELSACKEQFDVVMALHVLEHDDDATGLITKIAGYAKPGGTVVIEVPNIDCVWASWFGKYWDAWYLPYHRQHFTRESVVELVRRSGLEIDAVYDATVPTMGRTFANIFGSANNLVWLLIGILAHPIQVAGESFTNLPSAIRVIATKRRR